MHFANKLVIGREVKISRLCELFVCNGTCQHRAASQPPVTQSGIAPLVSLVVRYSQFLQISHLCSWLLPLLPDVHSESAPQPFVPSLQDSLHVGYIVISQPTADEYLYSLHDFTDVASTIAFGQKLEFCFSLSLCALVRTNENARAVLAKTESKKLEFLPRKDAC